jgi:hypothetical protein
MDVFSIILIAQIWQMPMISNISIDSGFEYTLLLAANDRQERRKERGRSDERQDRRDCRQEEGRVGDDKRECKQDEVRDGLRE